MIREGSKIFDPTVNMTPGYAERNRAKFKRILRESKDRIAGLRRYREDVIARIDEKIRQEESRISEANLVLRMIEDAFGEDYDEYPDNDTPPDNEDDYDIDVITKNIDEHHEIVLYGTPLY